MMSTPTPSPHNSWSSVNHPPTPHPNHRGRPSCAQPTRDPPPHARDAGGSPSPHLLRVLSNVLGVPGRDVGAKGGLRVAQEFGAQVGVAVLGHLDKARRVDARGSILARPNIRKVYTGKGEGWPEQGRRNERKKQDHANDIGRRQTGKARILPHGEQTKQALLQCRPQLITSGDRAFGSKRGGKWACSSNQGRAVRALGPAELLDDLRGDPGSAPTGAGCSKCPRNTVTNLSLKAP